MNNNFFETNQGRAGKEMYMPKKAAGITDAEGEPVRDDTEINTAFTRIAYTLQSMQAANVGINYDALVQYIGRQRSSADELASCFVAPEPLSSVAERISSLGNKIETLLQEEEVAKAFVRMHIRTIVEGYLQARPEAEVFEKPLPNFDKIFVEIESLISAMQTVNGFLLDPEAFKASLRSAVTMSDQGGLE